MVQRFRKKPVEFEALQFNGENFDEVIAFTKGNAKKTDAVGGDPAAHGHPHHYEKFTITTIHNGQTVDLVKGDYVIPEPDGINFW